MTAPWRRQATSSEPAVQPSDTVPAEVVGGDSEVAAAPMTEQTAELAALRQDLLSLTAEVSRNHGLLVEVQAMARRLLDTRLSFTERDGALALADALRPRSVDGPRKIRVGSAHDGGYVLLDDLAATPSVLCGGAGDNVDFERALAAAGHQVHVYDHTVAGLPGQGDGVTFFREPLGPEGTGLEAALERLDARGDGEPASLDPEDSTDQAPPDMLLKVDIDGGEWALFAAAGPHLPRFRQIALELHGLHQVGDALWLERALGALATIARTHTPVHVHANNYGAYAIVGGVPLPDILEVTYVRTDSYALGEGQANESDLDTPNDPSRPEFTLHFP